MNYKIKAKIQTIIFLILSIVGFGVCGGLVGFFIGEFKNSSGYNLDELTEFFLVTAAAPTIVLFCYLLSICLHEIGHMIFGFLSGYKFHSIRFGKLIFTKENGKLKMGKYNMPGMGGQCLMEMPDGNPEEAPVFLYHMGGLFINLFLFLISAMAAFCPKLR